MVKIAVSGACGRMGSRIIELSSTDRDIRLTCALENKGHPKLGSVINGIIISDNPDNIKESDCLIDFTQPEAAVKNLDFALKHRKAAVIGTTGLSSEQIEKINGMSKNIAIVLSANMSIGVNLLFKLIREAVSKLPPGYNIKITEAHHIHKKDAPSGTAKRIAEIIKQAKRAGVDGTERHPNGRTPVGIESIREGEIIGEHKITLDSSVDKIELTHSAKTRDIFAKGALEAAKWVVNQKSGLYNMEDVLD